MVQLPCLFRSLAIFQERPYQESPGVEIHSFCIGTKVQSLLCGRLSHFHLIENFEHPLQSILKTGLPICVRFIWTFQVRWLAKCLYSEQFGFTFECDHVFISRKLLSWVVYAEMTGWVPDQEFMLLWHWKMSHNLTEDFLWCCEMLFMKFFAFFRLSWMNDIRLGYDITL